MKKRAEKPMRVVRHSLGTIGCRRRYTAATNTTTMPPDPRSQRLVTPSGNIIDTSGWSMERRARYIELSILAEEACWVASKDPILYEKLMKFFQDIISKKQGYKNAKDGHKNSINQDAQTSEGTAAAVADPIQVSTEGALSKTQKIHFGRAPLGPSIRRAKAFNESSTHLCSLCREPGHNIRKCKQNPTNQRVEESYNCTFMH